MLFDMLPHLFCYLFQIKLMHMPILLLVRLTDIQQDNLRIEGYGYLFGVGKS
jgi:hypothetical protein